MRCGDLVGYRNHPARHLASIGVDATTAAALAAAAGAAVGLAAGLAFRASEASQRSVPAADEPLIPVGVDEVISVLRGSAVLFDEHLNVVKASPSAYAFGLVRPDRVPLTELAELTAAVLRDGRIREAEIKVPRSRGSTQLLHVAARVAPLRPGLLLALVEDRTQAIRIDEIRRDFVANVSHELKTPVGALSLLAEAVLDASDDPEAVRRFAGRMQQESGRLTRLVQEIIDLSRLQYDDPVESPEPVKVDEIVAGALDRSRVDAENRHIRLASGGAAGTAGVGQRVAARRRTGQPGRERRGLQRAAHPGRRRGAHARVSWWRSLSTDQGIGIRRERPGPDLRALLPRGPRPIAGDRRNRARPVDRQARRRESRR